MSPTIRTGIITGLATRYIKKSREKTKTEFPIPLTVEFSGPPIAMAKTASVAMNATKLWRSPLLNGRTKPMSQPITLNPKKNRKSNPAQKRAAEPKAPTSPVSRHKVKELQAEYAVRCGVSTISLLPINSFSSLPNSSPLSCPMESQLVATVMNAKMRRSVIGNLNSQPSSSFSK